MKHPRIRVCIYKAEHKNDDDFSQISMCSFGYGASYFIYKLFGKRDPADAKILPKKSSKVSYRSSQNRYPKVIAGGLGPASRLYEEAGQTAMSAKKKSAKNHPKTP